ncbi:MAG: RNA polymerase sigma factor [Pyrinomonadaceae bacterium]
MYVLTQAAEAVDYEETEGEDERLVARAVAGDRAAFALLYRRYYARTFALAYGMTGRREQADDMAQEIFLRAYERLASYRGHAGFRTWFYRLAVNHCLNHCRRERKYRDTVSDTDDGSGSRLASVAGPTGQIEDALARRQVQEQVRRALLTLKPEMRVLLVLKEIEGWSYEEIAERLECSTGTVASGLSRARKLLARKLESLKGKI